jgi:hypothetical protein
MTALVKDSPLIAFTPPAGLVKVWVCPLTQTLTCSACPSPKLEYFVEGTQPKKVCTDEMVAAVLASPSPSPEPNRDQILTGATVTENKPAATVRPTNKRKVRPER